jgi:hypothetical protein
MREALAAARMLPAAAAAALLLLLLLLLLFAPLVVPGIPGIMRKTPRD